MTHNYNINDVVETDFRVGRSLINLVRVETGWKVTNRSRSVIYGVISEEYNYCFFGWEYGYKFGEAINKAIRFAHNPFRFFVEQNIVMEIPADKVVVLKSE